jgi:hypothetical protein
MKTLNLKISSKTTTIVFETETPKQVKEIKALAIVFGYYNPLRQEMCNDNNILQYIDDCRMGRTSLEITISKIANQLI